MRNELTEHDLMTDKTAILLLASGIRRSGQTDGLAACPGTGACHRRMTRILEYSPGSTITDWTRESETVPKSCTTVPEDMRGRAGSKSSTAAAGRETGVTPS